MKKMNLTVWWWAATSTILIMATLTSEQCFSHNDLELASASSALEGSTKFAIDLFKSICSKAQGPFQNVFISPISIWSALMASYLGAQGTTEVELAKTLGLDNAHKGGVVNAFLGMKDKYTQNRNSNYTLRIANKIYFDQQEPVRECIQRNLQSEIEKVNFAGNAQSARTSINQWIESQTNNKIRDLLPSGSVDALTRIVIANAAYFKGFWEHPFAPQHTNRKDFFIQPKVIQPVEMMFQEETFPFASDPYLNCTAVEIPYVGKDISMVILLPNSNVEKLIPKLATRSLENLFSQMSPQLVRLAMPKFKAEETLELEDVLNGLGIRDLFNPSRADLSGFTGQAYPFVQSVRHKAFIDVNEEGTEAAAATSLITTYSFRASEPFVVNRPFAFMIRDKLHNTILFMGLIRNPT